MVGLIYTAFILLSNLVLFVIGLSSLALASDDPVIADPQEIFKTLLLGSGSVSSLYNF